MSSIFQRSFQTIGDAITNALFNGKEAAINFGSVMKAVATQVLQAFLQLAVLNPISNTCSTRTRQRCRPG